MRAASESGCVREGTDGGLCKWGAGKSARKDGTKRWGGVHGGGMVVGEACLYTLRHERT